MKSILFSCLLFGMLLLSGVTHAEGNCPDGMFETNPPSSQGPVGCAPIPGYNQQQGPQKAPRPPPEQWVDHWGAIAIYEPNGSLGTATNLPSQSSAENADCQSKHGSTCKIQLSYRNQCTAMAVSDKGYNVGSPATVDQAAQTSLKICRDSGDPNCPHLLHRLQLARADSVAHRT